MRTLLLLFILLVLPVAVQAQVKDSLVIELKTGKIVKIAFDQIDYVSFQTKAGVSRAPVSRPATQSYPNPSERGSAIAFTLNKPQNISVEIYDISGSLARHFSRRCESGAQELTWDGLIENGEPAPSGNYIYRFVADGKSLTGKLTVRR
jgi:flagellar hook assembly protein FlgD